MPDVSPRQIEVFRMVMRLGATSRAAAALHVSQPAVTQLLQQMEGRSGLKLFDHRRGRLQPTPQAHALMEEVERVYGGLEAIQRRIEALRSHEDEVLRVGSLHALAASVMPWAVSAFQREHPRTRCLLQVDSSQALREALFQGALDLAFLSDEADTSGLLASEFYRVPAVCAMPAAHPLARRARLTVADLAGWPLIGLSPADPAQRRLEAALEQAGVQVRFGVHTPYSATQCALVLAGAGVAVTNPLVAREYHPMGLRSVPLACDVYFAAVLGFKPRQAQSATAAAFVALCRRQLDGAVPARP
jgi:DNA-binding transcriptional LysR family regulator